MEETLLDLIRTTSVSTTVLTAKLLFRQITASNIQKSVPELSEQPQNVQRLPDGRGNLVSV